MKIDTAVIKELPLEFKGSGEVRGFFFTQVRSTGRGFLYSVMFCGEIWYEVFERKINSQYGTVSYPKSKSFGKWAWSYMSLDKALNKLESLNL